MYGASSAPLAIAHRGGAHLGLKNTPETFGVAQSLGVRKLPLEIPTLAAALQCFSDECFTIDIKNDASIEVVADVLRRTDSARRVCIAGA
jgi:glycerophosphoryl diester phosphodiesterase